MDGKLLLRPVALPVFLVSILLVIIPVVGPALTAAGVLFYAGAVYRAYQQRRNRALPPGTEDELYRLPYRRRRLGKLALAAARDIERRLAALPRDLASRVPLAATEAGTLAAGVVAYLRQEADANALATAGGGERAAALARDAGQGAEQLFGHVQELQLVLTELSLAGVNADRDALISRAARAVDDVRGLARALDAAKLELEGYTPPALPEGAAKGGERR